MGAPGLNAAQAAPATPRAVAPSQAAPAAPHRAVEASRPSPASAPRPPVPVPLATPRAVAITTAHPATPPPAIAAVTPKRRRSFTGEARPADKARAVEPARNHRRRRTFEDEAALRHTARTAPIPEASAAPRSSGLDAGSVSRAPAPAPTPDPVSMFDDLDEDTRVLQYRPDGGTDDVIDQAFDRLRANGADMAEGAPVPDAPTPPPVSPPAPRAEGFGPEDTLRPGTFAPGYTHEAPHGPPPEEPISAPPPSQNTKVWTLPEMDRPEPQTQRPASIADRDAPAGHAAAQPRAPRRLDTLPALRVAVLATSVPGEVRLIALETNDEAPPGAALAMLVPLTATDGEAVARLFGGHD